MKIITDEEFKKTMEILKASKYKTPAPTPTMTLKYSFDDIAGERVVDYGSFYLHEDVDYTVNYEYVADITEAILKDYYGDADSSEWEDDENFYEWLMNHYYEDAHDECVEGLEV